MHYGLLPILRITVSLWFITVCRYGQAISGPEVNRYTRRNESYRPTHVPVMNTKRQKLCGWHVKMAVSCISLMQSPRDVYDYYVYQGGGYAITSVSVDSVASHKKLCIDLHEIFTKGRSWPSLKVISFLRWSGLNFTVIYRSQSPSKVIAA